MGLASKMAAASGAAGAAYMGGQSGPGGPGYPGQQSSYPQQGGNAPYPSQGGLPSQAQYQAYPGANYQQGAQASSGGYGQPSHAQPPQQQGYGNQSYGQPPPQALFEAKQASGYEDILYWALEDKGLQPSMFPGLRLDAVAQKCPMLCSQLSKEWAVPAELVHDMAALALYDIVIFIDNSGSMRFEENGSRIDDLNAVLNRAVSAATKFDANGIQVRFMNQVPGLTQADLDGITQPQQIERLIGRPGRDGLVRFSGLTPLGTELRNQVLEPLVIQPIRNRTLQKPVLVLVITDGQPAGESRDTLRNSIQAAINASKQAYNGGVAVSFQIAQVGTDLGATKFLGELDEDPSVGNMVDVTSNFEIEETEFDRKIADMKRAGLLTGPAPQFSPDLWLFKLLLGGINEEHDGKDEVNRPPKQRKPRNGGMSNPSAQQGFGQQSSNYGRPPPPAPYPQQQGGYNPQQGSYPPQPQGGFPPQQGGYGRQQGNFPPQQQGGYAPQQQGGYPPQGGVAGQQNYGSQQGGVYPGQQQYPAPGNYGGQPSNYGGQGSYGGGPPPQPPKY